LTLDLAGGSVEVDAGSHFDIMFTGGGTSGFLASLPSVTATVNVDWFGPHAMEDPVPQVSFEGVQLEFDGLVSKVLAPIIEHLGPVVDKIGAVFNILNTEIPVLEQLIDPDPTVLSILGLAAQAGPPDFQAAVKFLEAVSKIVTIVDSLEAADGNLTLNLGGIQVGSELDLRSAPQVMLDDLVSLSIPELSMQYLGEEYTLDDFYADAGGFGGAFGASVSQLLDDLQNPVQLSIPFLEKPGESVFKLLLGQDVDFLRFDADLQREAGLADDVSIGELNLPGFSFNFGNTIGLDLNVGLGLDTRGIRRYLESKLSEGDPTAAYHFGDGFYITEGTHLTVSAGLAADLGVNILNVAHGHITGGVEGTLSVEVLPGESWEGTSDRIYLRTDMGDCLGHAGGGISAYLDAWVGLGIQIPFSGGKFLGGKKEFHLARKDLFKFQGLCIPNPFRFDPAIFEPATTFENKLTGDPDYDAIQDGELWLNIGPRHDLRDYLPDVDSEMVLVEHVATIDGLDTVRVTFGGQSKEYAGIHTIRAVGGSGDDVVTVDAGVTAYVELYGGDGLDTLVSMSSGDSVLMGEGDDDYLEVVVGAGTLEGGGGHDTLVGGVGSDWLVGGLGRDILVGGAGADTLHGDHAALENPWDEGDTIYGGAGTDMIFGGGGNDFIYGCSDHSTDDTPCDGQNEIHGGSGDDIIFAGPDGDTIFAGVGSDEVHAGAGDDTIATYEVSTAESPDARNYVYWEAGDGNTTILNSDRVVNTVSLFGAEGADTFEVRDGNDLPLGAFEFEIQVEAPGSKTVTMKNVSHLNVDGLGQSDTIHLNPLTFNPLAPHPLADVSVNLAPTYRDDGDEDHIYIRGTTGADELTVDSEQMLLVVPDSCEEQNADRNDRFAGCVWGGVMTVRGFPEYTIYATNVADDLQILTDAGDDQVTMHSNTGPTRIETADGDDQIVVRATTLGAPYSPGEVPVPADYAAEVFLDAGSGRNSLSIVESESEIADEIHIEDDRVHSQLLPGVRYTATGGNFGHLRVIGGLYADTLRVHSTSSQVDQTVVFGYDQPPAAEVPANDLVFISSTGDTNGDLLGIRNRLTVVGHHDTPTFVHISDRSAGSGNAQVTFAGNEITGMAGSHDEAVLELLPSGILEINLYGSDAAGVEEVFTFDAPVHPVTVYGGAGDERFDVLAATREVDLVGEAGDDQVTLSNLDSVQATVRVEGGAGSDTVSVLDQLAPAGKVYLVSLKTFQRNAAMVVFDTTLESFDLDTSNQSDSVVVTQMPSASQFHVHQGGGTNVLYGPNVASQWNITAPDAGTLNGNLSFESSGNLFGGSADDQFLFGVNGGVSGIVFGGSGTAFDTLDYSQYVQPVVFQFSNALGDGTANHIGNSFGGFESLVGGSSGLDELRGIAGNHLWDLKGSNTGLYHGTFTPIEFHSVENLTGSSGQDQFRINVSGSLAGRIDGGAGSDTLDYSLLSVNIIVDLLSGQATLVAGGVTQLENVHGGGGHDFIWGDNQTNELVGGNGHDVLVGRGGNDAIHGNSGRDLLIGGVGSDTIHGGNGDDILIGGTTSYDNDYPSLRRIMSEWTRKDLNYAGRINHLRFGGGLNGGVCLTAATVLNNDALDQLFGEAGEDWFFGIPLEVQEPLGGQQLN
jgi:hypothetical protein